MSKTPNPSCSQRAGWRLAWLTLPSVYECVSECEANVKRFGGIGSVKTLYKCSPFKHKAFYFS